MSTINHLEQLGYSSFFQEGRQMLGWGGFPVARVISESKGVYTVMNGDGVCLAKVTGKRMFSASSREDYPAVGDWTAIEVSDGNRAVIQGILPRQTIIKRTYGDKNRAGEKDRTQIIATNIDTAFIIASVDRDFSLNRFERYIAIAKNGGVNPAIVINKIDLLSLQEADDMLCNIHERFPDVHVLFMSTVTGEGLDALKAYIQAGKTYCFLGSSGVGKSSLINILLGSETIRTGDVGTYANRGRHVTTARHMYVLANGGIVIDNPGMREIGMTDVRAGIDASFDDIVTLAQGCKYADCTHTHEPDCAVLTAVLSGAVDDEHRANYVILKKEAEYSEMSDNEKREKDRRFGKFIQTAKKELKDFGK